MIQSERPVVRKKRVPIELSMDEWRALHEYRRQHNLPSMAAALRQLFARPLSTLSIRPAPRSERR